MGRSDMDQLDLIFDLCGGPTEESMPGWKDLPGCKDVQFVKTHVRRVKDEYERLVDDARLTSLQDKFITMERAHFSR